MTFQVEVMTNLVDGGEPGKLEVGDRELEGDIYKYKIKWKGKPVFAGKSRGMIGPELTVVDFLPNEPGRHILLRETSLMGGAFYDAFALNADGSKATRLFSLTARTDPEIMSDGSFYMVQDGPFWSTKQRYEWRQGKLARTAQALYRVDQTLQVKADVAVAAARSSKGKAIDTVAAGQSVTMLGYARSPQKCKAWKTVQTCDWILVKTPRDLYGWLTIGDAVKHLAIPTDK